MTFFVWTIQSSLECGLIWTFTSLCLWVLLKWNFCDFPFVLLCGMRVYMCITVDVPLGHEYTVSRRESKAREWWWGELQSKVSRVGAQRDDAQRKPKSLSVFVYIRVYTMHYVTRLTHTHTHTFVFIYIYT